MWYTFSCCSYVKLYKPTNVWFMFTSNCTNLWSILLSAVMYIHIKQVIDLNRCTIYKLLQYYNIINYTLYIIFNCSSWAQFSLSAASQAPVNVVVMETESKMESQLNKTWSPGKSNHTVHTHTHTHTVINQLLDSFVCSSFNLSLRRVFTLKV